MVHARARVKFRVSASVRVMINAWAGFRVRVRVMFRVKAGA